MVDDMVKEPPGDTLSVSMIIPDRNRLNNIS